MFIANSHLEYVCLITERFHVAKKLTSAAIYDIFMKVAKTFYDIIQNFNLFSLFKFGFFLY